MKMRRGNNGEINVTKICNKIKEGKSQTIGWKE